LSLLPKTIYFLKFMMKTAGGMAIYVIEE